MTTIHDYEIVNDDANYSEKTTTPTSLTLDEFAATCKQSPEWVLQLLEYGILPKKDESLRMQFSSDDLDRAQRAYRLQRDFDASLAAVAMMLDLIDEVQQLKKQLKQYQLSHH